MFKILRNAWKIADLRKKLLFTVFIIILYRLGSAVAVPFVDTGALAKATADMSTTLGLITLMSGGGFSSASIFALGIAPYINASIIIQLLTVAIPPLERLAKEGESGRRKIAQITRYVTVALGLLLGVAYYFMVRYNYRAIVPEAQSGFAAWFGAIVIILCFTAGSALVMWLGEQINDKGIGNGISILLFAGILSRIPTGFAAVWSWVTGGFDLIKEGSAGYGVRYMATALGAVVILLAMIALIVFITDAERRIPVQYAKRVVGRKMYGGQSTYIPIKVNMSGVMPIILAVSIVSLPSTIAGFIGKSDATTGFWGLMNSWFSSGSWVYILVYFVLIIAFAFFYVTIQYDPVEMSNNLRKNGGSITGYRPGKPTSDYIKRVLNKVTLIGALFLGFIALFPSVFGKFTGFYGLTIGGTSIMIVVGVALETVQQIESQMMMRHYKGFLE